MKFLYNFFNILIGRYQFRIFDFFLDENGHVMFIITPIHRLEPREILLEDLVKDQKILNRLDEDSSRLLQKVLDQVKEIVLARTS